MSFNVATSTSENASSGLTDNVHPSRAQNIEESSAFLEGNTGNTDGATVGSSLEPSLPPVDPKDQELAKLRFQVASLKMKDASREKASAPRGVKRGSSPTDFDDDVIYIRTKRVREESPTHDDYDTACDTDWDGFSEDSFEPLEQQTVKMTPKNPAPSILDSKWSPHGEYANSERSGSNPSTDKSAGKAPAKQATRGRPPTTASKNQSITKFCKPRSKAAMEYQDETLILEPSSYVLGFGKHRGALLSDVPHQWLSTNYYMPNVRNAHPDFYDAATMELDRRLVIEARAERDLKYANVIRNKSLQGKGSKFV